MATWSGMRAKLEKEYLAESLRGRIQYFATTYKFSHDREGRACVRFDGEEILKSNYYDMCQKQYEKELEIRKQEVVSENWYMEAWRQAVMDGCFDQREFYSAFSEFDNQSIEDSLKSKEPIVRLFAILDRRVGKRRLLAMKEEMEAELPWIKMFYDIRMEAEGLKSTGRNNIGRN